MQITLSFAELYPEGTKGIKLDGIEQDAKDFIQNIYFPDMSMDLLLENICFVNNCNSVQFDVKPLPNIEQF